MRDSEPKFNFRKVPHPFDDLSRHGTDELIDSDHVDGFHVRCVNAMCAVLPLKKFEELGGQCAKDDNGNPLPVCIS